MANNRCSVNFGLKPLAITAPLFDEHFHNLAPSAFFKIPVQSAKHALVHNNTGTIILHLPSTNLI
jgi:hypothetical protein